MRNTDIDTPTMKVKILAFYPNDSGRNPLILGYADVALLDLGIAIRGIIIKVFNEQINTFMPAKALARHGEPILSQRGKPIRQSCVYFSGEATFHAFRRAVVDALKAAYPEAFTNLPPPPIKAAGNTPVGALCHE